MNKVFLIFILSLILNSCKQKVQLEKYDKNGNLIVYSQEVYTNMWIKNKKLKVTVIDTFCINQKVKAKKDIKNGKLIYFGFHPREFKKMTEILKEFGIKTKEHLGTCIRMGGFEPYCYQEEMYKEINRKYGENFIDSIFKVAQKEFIIENPNIEYMEDGIDLRKKILEEKNSH
jgi:predicted rRNA methylase YqxC with S4 and FtsJ domains